MYACLYIRKFERFLGASPHFAKYLITGRCGKISAVVCCLWATVVDDTSIQEGAVAHKFEDHASAKHPLRSLFTQFIKMNYSLDPKLTCTALICV